MRKCGGVHARRHIPGRVAVDRGTPREPVPATRSRPCFGRREWSRVPSADPAGVLYALTGIYLDVHIQSMIETFAALAEPNRFRIVELLRSGARSVNEIGERLDLNQPQVSKHLRVLRDVGLVRVEPRAQQRVYDLQAKPLRQMNDWL